MIVHIPVMHIPILPQFMTQQSLEFVKPQKQHKNLRFMNFPLCKWLFALIITYILYFVMASKPLTTNKTIFSSTSIRLYDDVPSQLFIS